MIFPALVALLLQPGLSFSGVRAWRWSEGRGEFIPALSAAVENRSGTDYETVRILVRVRCGDGTAAEYRVTARDVLLGRQQIEATAYDAIGVVRHCEGPAEAVPLEASPYPPERRPAFAVFGFSVRDAAGAVSTALEGILDYRAEAGAPPALEVRTWHRHGARFTLPEAPDAAIYVVRVPPGRMGLAGFALEPSPEPKSPLSRFLRFYDIPPGEARWLGIFRLELERPGRAAVVVEPSPELAAAVQQMLPRAVLPARGAAPSSSSTLVTR
ncbi:MAG: hypothetical protein N2036_01590 [Bryobacteraceae bacterium]|nr:hypothetical protein [Bryobacteraceae bacterium]MCX7602744.1 hypothetical protein [Bryobacteraceae bacterium]